MGKVQESQRKSDPSSPSEPVLQVNVRLIPAHGVLPSHPGFSWVSRDDTGNARTGDNGANFVHHDLRVAAGEHVQIGPKLFCRWLPCLARLHAGNRFQISRDQISPVGNLIKKSQLPPIVFLSVSRSSTPSTSQFSNSQQLFGQGLPPLCILPWVKLSGTEQMLILQQGVERRYLCAPSRQDRLWSRRFDPWRLGPSRLTGSAWGTGEATCHPSGICALFLKRRVPGEARGVTSL